MLYVLNLHNIICQLYLNKAEEKDEQEELVTEVHIQRDSRGLQRDEPNSKSRVKAKYRIRQWPGFGNNRKSGRLNKHTQEYLSSSMNLVKLQDTK